MAATLFPDGKEIAVVTSWDDGRANDRLMHEMLDKYGYKGTFYVCTDTIGTEGYLDADGLAKIAATGHEIGSHSLNHPHLETLAPAELALQMTESKAKLEALLKTKIGSFAYPFGLAADGANIVEAARAAGYDSARTTETAEVITLDSLRSSDLLRFPVTAYFTDDFMTIAEKWDAAQTTGGIFHLWGHSDELSPNVKEWVDFECILGFLGGISNVWYGTVGELIAHLKSAS